MTKEEALYNTLLMVNPNNNKIQTISPDDCDISEINNIENYDFLPELQKDEFIIYLSEDNIISCCKDLNWFTVQDIECKSYKQHLGQLFYSESYEQQQLLKSSLKWWVDLQNKEINYSKNIEFNIGVKIIKRLKSKLKLSEIEAKSLYDSTICYFKNNGENKPIYPVIIETDMLLKFGSMNLDDIKNIKSKKMEEIKLVLLARSECFKNNEIKEEIKEEKTKENPYQNYPGLFPTEIRDRIYNTK